MDVCYIDINELKKLCLQARQVPPETSCIQPLTVRRLSLPLYISAHFRCNWHHPPSAKRDTDDQITMGHWWNYKEEAENKHLEFFLPVSLCASLITYKTA